MLSTLHTNDAPGALSRLTEMGIEPFLTSSAVDAVLAQRLARRLCKHCKEPYTATKEMLRKNDFPPEVCDRDDVVLHRAKGCSRCNNTGYRGRLGLYEVMIVSEAIRRLTVERKSADEIGARGGGRGDEVASRRRHRQGSAGHDLRRGDRPRDHLIWQPLARK